MNPGGLQCVLCTDSPGQLLVCQWQGLHTQAHTHTHTVSSRQRCCETPQDWNLATWCHAAATTQSMLPPTHVQGMMQQPTQLWTPTKVLSQLLLVSTSVQAAPFMLDMCTQLLGQSFYHIAAVCECLDSTTHSSQDQTGSNGWRRPS